MNVTSTPEKMIDDYRQGRLTSHGLILELLQNTRKRRLESLLEALPSEVREELVEFVAKYRPTMKAFRGAAPKEQAVRLVQEWLIRTDKAV